MLINCARKFAIICTNVSRKFYILIGNFFPRKLSINSKQEISLLTDVTGQTSTNVLLSVTIETAVPVR